MNDIAIKLDNVSKYYKLYNSPSDRLKEALSPFGKLYHRDFYALKNINLEIKKGEILGVIGRNGCGKSTLLKLIAGVLTPNEGKITVSGKVSALLELGSGFNPEFTGLQNIFFYGSILGFSRYEMEEKQHAILEFAGIGDFIDQPIKTYSSGMKARLAFAAAIHVDPEILILDEVLAVGDALFQRKCFIKMEELFNCGKTIIYVSHDTNSVNQLCTRAILLAQGKIIIDGSPKIVTAEYARSLHTKRAIGNDGLEKGNGVRRTKATPESSENFDIGLRTEIIVKEGNADIEFYDYHILNKEGEKVNVLKVHEKYSYIYYARVKRSLKDVYFCAGIRDKMGVHMTWVIDDDSKKALENACVYKIAWDFTCRLHAGLYYTSAGLRDTQLELLRQELDTFVFKVEKNIRRNKGGIFESSWTCNTVKEFV